MIQAFKTIKIGIEMGTISWESLFKNQSKNLCVGECVGGHNIEELYIVWPKNRQKNDIYGSEKCVGCDKKSYKNTSESTCSA